MLYLGDCFFDFDRIVMIRPSHHYDFVKNAYFPSAYVYAESFETAMRPILSEEEFKSPEEATTHAKEIIEEAVKNKV